MRRFWFHKDEEVKPDALIKVIKKEPKDEELEKEHKLPARRTLPRGIIWGILGLVIIFVAGLIASLYAFSAQVKTSLAKNADTLQSGVADLANFNPSSAAQKFSSLEGSSMSDFGAIFNALGFLFRGSRDAVASFSDLATHLTSFSRELSGIASSSYTFFVSGRGEEFVASLSRIRSTLGALDAASDKLSNAASITGASLSFINDNSYFAIKSQLQDAESFLDAFIPWLSDARPHHILVLLQNPSEIRPGGGFLGSYADVTIEGGNIKSIDVHDIADVDAEFNQKIIPPKQLQLTQKSWRPADANWFFDFPTSASKTISFFEASDLFAKTSTTFDGAIAVSPKVVSDLLLLSGPISTKKPSTTFTADNFLVQTQKIVQDGQATSATYPKQVLRDFSQALLAKLNSRESSESNVRRQELFEMMLDWASKRELMFYMKDPIMERFAAQYGVAGDVYELPQKFNGDYFSAVDANVGGGKSDLYVSSTISYVGQIGADGTLTAHVAVSRKHNGNKSPYWWYKTPNWDYMQFFVPDGSSIQNASGGIERAIVAKVNYAKNGYTTDPLVSAIEETKQSLFAYPGISWHAESGKRVFETWSSVKAGAATKFSLDYSHRLFVPPAPGATYQFIFEKQAGTNRHYSLEVDAPLGYVFAENGIASWSYESDDLPGRLIVNLTLKKI